jgi:prolyl oligopeptidase
MEVKSGAIRYPETRVEDTQSTLADLSVPDPYRWLGQDSEEVRQWQRAQARLATAHVREWPGFDRLRSLVERFNEERLVTLPRYAAGCWFRKRISEGASQAQAVVSDEPMSEGRVLFDPYSENPVRPPFLSWLSPSPDGKLLAVGVCSDGSESNTIRLIDVRSGNQVDGAPTHTLMDNWAGAQWLPDSSGFFFTATTGSPTDLEQSVFLHRRLPSPTTEPMYVPWSGVKECRAAVVSPDGRHVVALERINDTIPVAIGTIGACRVAWRPFVTSVVATVAGHVIGDRYIAVTNLDAPRGRLIAIPLDAADPNDPATWQELVAESDAVLRTVTPVCDLLYLTEFVDTYARVRIVTADGRTCGEVPLPMRGALSEMAFPIGNLIPKGHPNRFVFALSSLTKSWGIYSHTPGQKGVETIQAPQVELEGAVVEDRWALSTGGARIPYHIVRGSERETSTPQPTLIYAYGGFNVSLVPQFPGMMAAFVAAGGVFVHAHLRGGGEFGRDWWESGRHANKQNCYDDLYAVAEDLIAQGRCTSQKLAVTGGSNGGLMAGVAVTQRPDLWAVVIPRVPRLDLIAACQTDYGRRATLEDRVVSLTDSREIRRLVSLSPYHSVRDGVAYPAVFIDAGDTDPRCPPQDARKFAARLQKASSGDGPILLHVWENVGHGWATDRQTAITEYTEWLAFTLRHLGV